MLYGLLSCQIDFIKTLYTPSYKSFTFLPSSTFLNFCSTRPITIYSTILSFQIIHIKDMLWKEIKEQQKGLFYTSKSSQKVASCLKIIKEPLPFHNYQYHWFKYPKLISNRIELKFIFKNVPVDKTTFCGNVLILDFMYIVYCKDY